MSLLDYIDQERLPNHIAIIMDGNGRWATNKGFERGEGHKEGVRAISRVVEAATKASIKYLTLYAFSTENWNRPAEEVNGLMDLMVYAISEETEKLKKNGVRITCIGDMDRLPEYARTALIECIDQTKEGNTLTLNIALSYSSKWELTEAARRIADDVLNGVLNKEDISEETISMYLTTHGIPDPDLLIRTGGEQRISNFLYGNVLMRNFTLPKSTGPTSEKKTFMKQLLTFRVVKGDSAKSANR